MSTGDKTSIFEPLPMKRRTLIATDANQYCIWEEGGEAREIKADTAYEAFRKSGQKNIIKIERMFNLNENILSGYKFKQEIPEDAKLATSAHSLQEKIRLRKNPIISADELDELMRAMRQQEDSVSSVVPVDASASGVAVETLNPVGLEVHGDGFDEIIPASLPKAATAKAQETSQSGLSSHSAAPSASELPPERELSPEEVANLLSGK